MKRLNNFIITYVFLGLAEVIIDGVAHSISIDTIAAYATYFTIRDVVQSLTLLCLYTYKVTRKDEGRMLGTSMLISVGVCIIVWFLRLQIAGLFALSGGQREILLRLMNLMPLSIFSTTLVDSIFDILRLKDRLKLHNVLCVLYYIIIFTGYYISYMRKDISWAVVGIIIGDIIVSLIAMMCDGIKLKLPNKGVFLDIKNYGVPVCTERLINQVNIFVCSIFASHIGDYEYTLYSVCYAVNSSLELVTNAYYSALMVEVPLNKPFKRQYEISMLYKRKAYLEILVLRIALGGIYLLILHGKVPLVDCFPVILVYILPTTPLVIYETYKVICLASKQTDILMISGLIACILRVLLCFICYRFSIAIWLFGIIIPLKFLTYVICERYMLEKRGYFI